MVLKQEPKKCVACKQIIPYDSKDYKISEKILYPDKDGVWYTYSKVYMCEKCMNTLRDMTKHFEN